MENETIDNSIDFTPLIEEIQILNQGIVSNGERLDQINEYLILKDKEEKKEKQAAEEQAAEENEAAEKQAAEENEAAEKQAAETREAQQQTEETYMELLTEIMEEQQLTNQMFAGQFLLFGIITGILLFKILWDKLT